MRSFFLFMALTMPPAVVGQVDVARGVDMARLEPLLRAHEQAVDGQRAKLDPAALMITMEKDVGGELLPSRSPGPSSPPSLQGLWER